MAQFQAKDLTGQRFELVTALAPTGRKAPDGSTIWQMRCDCGKEFERSAGKFRKSKSCGCLQRHNSGQFAQMDLTGYQSATSLAIQPTGKRMHTYTVWIMRCLLCGDTFETAAYNITKGQAAHRCAAWHAKYSPRIGRPPIPDSMSHVNALYGQYRRSAQIRGLAFDITKEQSRTLFDNPCHYCGAPPSTSYTHPSLAGTYAWNGIDRVDNAVGYTVDNCVSCCSQCNFAKRDLTYTEFVTWARRLAVHVIHHHDAAVP